MEYGRFDQINKLKQQGWTYLDESLKTSLSEELVCGGPTLMKDENGVIYNVSCGREWPYEGSLYDSDNKQTNYSDGKPISA